MVPSTGSYLASVDENVLYLTSKSHACKGRFQISAQKQDHVARSHIGDNRIDTETRHCIRNFRVIQIVCISHLCSSISLILSQTRAKNFTGWQSERLVKADALLKEASQRLEKHKHTIDSANYIMAQGLLQM
jgi:hypothetical protein